MMIKNNRQLKQWKISRTAGLFKGSPGAFLLGALLIGSLKQSGKGHKTNLF